MIQTSTFQLSQDSTKKKVKWVHSTYAHQCDNVIDMGERTFT